MREIMRKLDEVTRTAQELRQRVQQEMDDAQQRDSPAGDDPEVTRARKTPRTRPGRTARTSSEGSDSEPR